MKDVYSFPVLPALLRGGIVPLGGGSGSGGGGGMPG